MPLLTSTEFRRRVFTAAFSVVLIASGDFSAAHAADRETGAPFDPSTRFGGGKGQAHARKDKGPAAPEERILPIQHHSQSTESWCWAASIAMIAQYLRHEPVDDCHVASRLDRATGGLGRCCDHAGEPIDEHCNQGRNIAEMNEVMNWYFNLKATLIPKALSWEDLRHSIDAGFPVLAGLFGNGGGHAVVLVGYREPDVIYVDDPWQAKLPEPLAVHYRAYARGMWKMSFYFPQDEIAGVLSGGGHHDGPTEKGHPGHQPPLASVSATFPLVKNEVVRAFVNGQMEQDIDGARGCYEDAVATSATVPSPALIRLKFSVEHGNPAWIMTKDAGGLDSAITGCIAETVSRWTGLFPATGAFDETQLLELRFARLAAVDAGPKP